MTAKYSTDQNDANQWHSDNRYVMGQWSTKPFVGHRHKYETVEHRLVIEYHDGVGVDIFHECRSEDSNKFADEWAVVEAIEVRDYGARHEKQPERRYLR